MATFWERSAHSVSCELSVSHFDFKCETVVLHRFLVTACQTGSLRSQPANDKCL